MQRIGTNETFQFERVEIPEQQLEVANVSGSEAARDNDQLMRLVQVVEERKQPGRDPADMVEEEAEFPASRGLADGSLAGDVVCHIHRKMESVEQRFAGAFERRGVDAIHDVGYCFGRSFDQSSLADALHSVDRQ